MVFSMAFPHHGLDCCGIVYMSPARLPVTESKSIVDLGYATYQGVLDPASNNTHFLGMRFAAPPTGPLRFSAPRSPSHVPGIQIADSQPARCYEASSGTAPTNPFQSTIAQKAPRSFERRQAVPTSEDCLFLKYLSGAASGWSGTDVWNGDDLITFANGQVVAVVIQYRLGLFGFLPGEAVKAGGALNAGLLDQDFALRWVHKHIHKFGGNPSQVTIWGESAGAGSVLQQVIANGGQTHPPLFRGAIASSTFLPSQYAYNDVIPETLYRQTLESANCTTSANTLDCLRQTDAGILQAANTAINRAGFFGTFVFVPVVDGTFIRQRASEALRAGKVNGQALYVVANSNEGELFMDPRTRDTVNISTYISNLFPRLLLEDAAKGAALYGGSGLGSAFQQATTIMAEAIFVCPSYYFLKGFKKRPAFKALFAVPTRGHGSDYVYYFPSTSSTGVPPYNNTQFSTAFAGSFMAFVQSLNPNKHVDPTNITPPWKTWSATDQNEMLFNRTETFEPVVEPTDSEDGMLTRCAFWESVGAQNGQ